MRCSRSIWLRDRTSSARRMDLEDLAGNDHALDLAGAFADGTELDVAIELLSRIILDETIAAEELDSLVADAHGDFAGEELGHGRLTGDLAAGILENSSALGEKACGIQLGSHVGELPLDALELGDGFAELPAFLDVFEGSLECAAADAEGECSDGDASAVEDTHGIDEAFAFEAEEVFGWDFAVFEDEF